MTNTTLTFTKSELLAMSDAQARILIQSGIKINFIGDTIEKQSHNVSTKVETTGVVKTPKAPAKKGEAKALAFGKIKKGDYFAVYNKTGKKPVMCNVGIAKAIEDDVVVYAITKDEKKEFALENCVAITKAQYGQLKKRFSKKSNKQVNSTSKRLNEHDYTLVMAYLANKQDNKIDYIELAKQTTDSKDLADIRKDIKKSLPDFKLTAEEAVKTFASLTSSSEKAN